METLLTKFGEDLFVSNSFQMIRYKGLKFSGFDGGHAGVVVRKSGEESK